MFRRLLVANRGEVAARVVRTCRRMGVVPVVLASEPDARAAWLQGPDAPEVALLEGAAPRDTYLDMDKVIAAARAHRCAALHPGWGFLAENALFAARCASEGVRFIGPSPAAMRRLGNKIASRRTMKAGGVPVLPGSEGVVGLAEARAIAAEASLESLSRTQMCRRAEPVVRRSESRQWGRKRALFQLVMPT